MLELVSYGLTGLAAIVVMASCFAYSDDFSLRGKCSINLTDLAHWLLSRRAGEKSTGSVFSGVPSKSEPGKASHG
jgi:hypothetical protein